MNLSKIDLNLLVIFDALHELGQVTRVAQKVGLTQSAVSNALARLRLLFDDQLFVRIGNTMEPTVRARELSRPIGAALAQVANLLGPAPFIPAQAELTLRIATVDHIEATLLPALLIKLRALAPSIKLASRRVEGIFELPREDLQGGKVDLAIGSFPQPQPPNTGIAERRLYAERLVCILRSGHPALSCPLTLKRFVSLDHVAVFYPGRGMGLVDRVLESHGVQRTVVFSVPHFSSAAIAAANSDWVATVPYSVAQLLAGPLGLSSVDLPITIPELSIAMFWHSRNTADSASLWIRDRIIETVTDIQKTAQVSSLRATHQGRRGADMRDKRKSI